MQRFFVRLNDGTTAKGEYVGAMDGYLYLSEGDEVIRVKQSEIALLASSYQNDFSDEPADE